MTTMTIQIDDSRPDIVEAFEVIVSSFKDVSYKISNDCNQEEVLASIRQSCRDIKSGEGVKNAIPIEDFYKELAND